jgi:ubiquinone/menaquinone biosynthesis C-methylase UbiE
MKTPEQRAQEIFSQRAAFYTTSAAHKDPQVLARLVALAQPQPHWDALDVATGTGHTALALAPHVRHVIGTDITPAMLDEARKLQAQLGIENVEFRIADVHHLPFDEHSYDLVTSRRAPHHFSAIDAALREMHRVLRPGARLVIDDRSVPEDDFVDACMNELDRLHDASHVRQYRPSEWQRMLTNAGFSVEHMEPYTQHRPLTSLTQGVDEEDVARIRARLDALNDEQRRALNYRTVQDEPYINHWYILLSARS